MAAGLSLGEYTALVFAGSLEVDDAIRVVAERGRAMQDCAEATPGGMVAVLGLEREAVAALCDACRGGDVLEVAVPTWRPDSTIEVDIVEEIGRHHGFSRIPKTVPSSPHTGELSERQQDRRSLRRQGC